MELLSIDGKPIDAEPIQLTYVSTGEAHDAAVCIGDHHVDPSSARANAAEIIAVAAVVKHAA